MQANTYEIVFHRSLSLALRFECIDEEFVRISLMLYIDYQRMIRIGKVDSIDRVQIVSENEQEISMVYEEVLGKYPR